MGTDSSRILGDIVVLKNKFTGRMNSVIGANLLPDTYVCDPCGTKACDMQAELNLSPSLPNTRKQSPLFGDLSPESTNRDFSKIVI